MSLNRLTVVHIIDIVFCLHLLRRMNSHPHFVGFVKFGHEEGGFACGDVDAAVTIGLGDSKEVPKCALLFDFVIDIVIILMDCRNALEETDSWALSFLPHCLNKPISQFPMEILRNLWGFHWLQLQNIFLAFHNYNLWKDKLKLRHW